MFAHFQIIHCYGTRVAVISVPAPPQLKTEIALNVVGPGAFGYDVEFCPLPGRRDWITPRSAWEVNMSEANFASGTVGRATTEWMRGEM